MIRATTEGTAKAVPFFIARSPELTKGAEEIKITLPGNSI